MARPEYSSAVYIDDRVKTERWVRRNSTDESTRSSLLADECEVLRTAVDSLLDVCKESKFAVYSSRDLH
jgi:3',5'-cyclic-nucleotide phosphodiesterase